MPVQPYTRIEGLNATSSLNHDMKPIRRPNLVLPPTHWKFIAHMR
jgi:hypothetical protein